MSSINPSALAVAFERAPLLMTISEVETGRYIEVNDAFVRVTGYSRQRAVGETSVELGLISAAERARLVAPLKAEGRVADTEVELRHADGTPLYCSYAGELIEVDGQTRLLSIASNITQHKQVEARLGESEARFSVLFEHMLQSVVVCEAAGDGSVVIVGANRRTLDGLAVTSEALLGRPAVEVFPGWETDGVLELLRRVAETGESESLPAHECSGGTLQGWFRHSVFRMPSGHVAVLTEDVTEEQAARRELELVRLAIEQAEESVVITDRSGTILYVNPAFERTTGYPREEVVGRNPRILKSGHHKGSYYARMWQALGAGEVWRGRLVNRRRDGEPFTEEAVISPLRDSSGEIANFVAVKRDVTEVARLEADLRHAQKMDAIGQLTGGVAHDFNNLLQVILGALELADGELDPKHPAHGEVEAAREAASSAASLVGKLLLFSRRQPMQQAVLSVDDAVAEHGRLLARVIGERIFLQYDLRGGRARVLADPGMLEQCLVNLCVNARDAMPRGGTLTLRTRRVHLAREDLRTPWLEPGAYIRLDVIDTGEGIPDEVLEHVFEPFFTTKGPGKGTGLGLATVYGILEHHGGVARVLSAPGEGTTVELYWPVHEGEIAEPALDDAPRPEIGAGTVLLAEDERPVREVTRRMLERAGYEVLTAEDGASAVRLFEAARDSIDLVILDAVMPGMGGSEAFARIRALRADVPVLIASGYSEGELSADLFQSEGFTALAKPFSRAELLAAVRAATEC